MEKNKKSSSFGRFLRQNLALVIIVACAVAACVLALALNGKNKIDKPVGGDSSVTGDGQTGVPDEPPIKIPEKKQYLSPISTYTVGMDYSRDSEYVLVYKKTLNEYSVHNGIDLIAEKGTAVLAINDGKVTKVTNDFGMGYTVEITHDDGYVSRYCSLGEDVTVTVGQEVERGHKIGTTDTTASFENLEGAHLHLEILKDGAYVNPRDVIEF